jgi:hypothetical protein
MPKSIDEVVREGNFKYVYDLFQGSMAVHWNPGMGTEVRGEFVLLAMPLPLYTENDLVLRMERVGGRRLKAATAYELAVFAKPGKDARWDGKTTVMAHGSKAGRGAVPRLDSLGGASRRLTMQGPGDSQLWRNNRSVLCVKV